jgi:hypothetical protein
MMRNSVVVGVLILLAAPSSGSWVSVTESSILSDEGGEKTVIMDWKSLFAHLTDEKTLSEKERETFLGKKC